MYAYYSRCIRKCKYNVSTVHATYIFFFMKGMWKCALPARTRRGSQSQNSVLRHRTRCASLAAIWRICCAPTSKTWRIRCVTDRAIAFGSMYLLQFTLQYMYSNSLLFTLRCAQNEIIDVIVNDGCNRTKDKDLEKVCESLVRSLAPAIFMLVGDALDRDQACFALGICPNTTSPKVDIQPVCNVLIHELSLDSVSTPRG